MEVCCTVQLLAGLAEVLSPMRCAGCDLPGSLLCTPCRAALPLIPPAEACPRCGARTVASQCTECRGRDFVFDAASCAGILDGPLSRMLSLYKDAGERRYAPILGALAADAAARWRGWADAVVPIPSTRAARARRGFDHVVPLASAVAAALDVPLLTYLRAARRLDQRGLGREERMTNMAAAFVVLPIESAPRRVVVVDDVMTTGATLDAAATLLMGVGVGTVRVVSVARAQDRPPSSRELPRAR
jgi:predicted amidophosphoribosyltransferase